MCPIISFRLIETSVLIYYSCKNGFTGPTCDRPCPQGFFGRNCSESCRCTEHGSCNPVDGVCQCDPGWTEGLSLSLNILFLHLLHIILSFAQSFTQFRHKSFKSATTKIALVFYQYQ